MIDKQDKDDFIASWNDLLPDGVLNFAETAIPNAPTIATPTTVDDAIIAQGVLAKYLLDFFHEFNGMTPIDVILHIGQRNAVNKAIMVSRLEYVEKAEADFEIISPVTSDQEVYETNVDIEFSIRISADVQEAMDSLEYTCGVKLPEDPEYTYVTLEQNPLDSEIFKGWLQISTPSESWSATYIVTFNGFNVTKIVVFSVQS